MPAFSRLPIVAAGIESLVAAHEGRLMNEPAFLVFYARTSGPLAGYLRRLTGNGAVAEDLLQDAYVRFLALTRIPETDDHRRNYLFRIATNLARDHFRRERRFQTLADRDGSMASEPTVAPIDPCATSDVWSRLANLSPRDRELLLLAYVEGLSHKEIAAVTGLMRASVRPLLFRARQRFAVILRAAGLTPTDGATS